LTTDTAVRFSLEPDNPSQLANLCGQLDEHLKLIESRLGIQIRNRGNDFQLVGDHHSTRAVSRILHNLYQEAGQGVQLTPELIHLSLQESAREQASLHTPLQTASRQVQIKTPKLLVKARGDNQTLYLNRIRDLDINFGIGPAGTGKTFLAVACAVDALERDEVRRIILVRPAVEAGEKLGFLPGDLAQKIDPYLRPLYDALYEMLGVETVTRLIERQIIEVAPLAYMRGRTLSHAFVILDESQNTTKEQMKMFLTRIGFGSAAVITGDITQIDLPKATVSGLNHATEVLRGVEGIGFTHFDAADVVRHPLVQRIVRAYDKHKVEQENEH
jgi:phosphate starvation-inducible PhoH-like protein